MAYASNSSDENNVLSTQIDKSKFRSSQCEHSRYHHENPSVNDESIDREENSSNDDDEEAVHFRKIIDAFLFYQRHAELKLSSKVKSIRALSPRHAELIPKFGDHIRRVHQCIKINYNFLKTVVTSTGRMFENRDVGESGNSDDERIPVASEFNMDKLDSTLRQIVRDWSSDGATEREQCYGPILEKIQQLWPNIDERKNVRILLPGAGLGRLAYDVARLGFECQGNEFSLFMLFVSNFILNSCRLENEWTVYPYIRQWTNNWTYDDQVRPVRFPDTNPTDLSSTTESNFSMTAGDFLDVYGKKSEQKWDCVASVFFIDTARNVIDYLDVIYGLLKPGGYWLNLGPLLYHFADMDGEISLELPYEDVLNVARKIGFEIVGNEKVKTNYTQNSKSMLKYEYDCAYTIFKKC